MSDATFTFRVDEDLKAEFAYAAKAHDRTGAQLLRDFMRSYVAQQQEAQHYDAWLADKVAQARASGLPRPSGIETTSTNTSKRIIRWPLWR